MARELAIQIKVEGTAQATAALNTVEKSIKGVESSTKTTSAEMDKWFPQIGQMKGQLADLSTKTDALSASTLAVGKSFSSMMAAGTVAVAAVGALGTAMYTTSKYFAEQSGIMAAHEKSIESLADAWGRFKFRVGQALIGAGADVRDYVQQAAKWLDWLAQKTSQGIAFGIRAGQNITGVSAYRGLMGVGPGANLARQYLDPATGQYVTSAAGYLAGQQGTLASWMNLNAAATSGMGAEDAFKLMEADARKAAAQTERLQAAAARAAAAAERMQQAFLDAAQRATANWYYGNAAMGGGWSNMGLHPGIGWSTGQQIAADVTQGRLASSNIGVPFLVGSPGAVNTGGAGASWLGRLGTAMPYVTGIAGLAGMFGGSSTVGRIGSGAASGAGAGAMVGTFVLPGIGTALGAGIGALAGGLAGLFGGGARAQRRKDERQADASIGDLQSQLLETYGTLEQIRLAGDMVGVSLAEAWGDKSIKGLEHFKGLMDEFLKKQDQLQTALEKYGLTWEDLGETAKNFFFQQEAAQLLSDFQLLSQAGVETDRLLQAMAGSFNQLIQEAMRNGLELPSALKPMVERLIEMGLILDETGNKIEDIGRISFRAGYTAAQGFKQFTDSVDGWQPPEITIPVRYDRQDGDDISTAYSTGGWVTPTGAMYFARGGFVPRGTDTVPAMLTPGEYVMSRAAVDRLGVGLLSSLNHGQSLTVNVGGVSVDARGGVWENPATSQRMADAIADRLVTRVRSQLRWH